MTDVLSNGIDLTSTEQNSNSDENNDISFTKMVTDNEINNERCCPALSPEKFVSHDRCNDDVFPKKKKSRIRHITTSGSDSESQENNSKESNSTYNLTRTKIKSNNLRDKFKKLKSSTKNVHSENINLCPLASDATVSDESNNSDGAISCLKIKQKVKKKSSHSLTEICDPDTSDEENHSRDTRPSKSKSTKLTSPKAVRMSAKQAMENMKKIKSESNRMLREKQVSLPYHRPRALTLKDIMNRRKLAISSDGKSLPIKMNNEQLKQYAFSLEQRQKEMMELCKSDTDEEEHCYEDQVVPVDDSNKSELVNETNNSETKITEENYADSSDINDKTFDDVIMENDIVNCEINLNKRKIEDTIPSNKQLEVDVNLDKESCDQKISEQIILNTVESEKLGSEIGDVPENISLLRAYDSNESTEQDSQMISFHYDSEKTDVVGEQDKNEKETHNTLRENAVEMPKDAQQQRNISDEFSDNDFTMEELNKIIENTEVNKNTLNKLPANIGEIKPKLMGAPGMVIHLDNDGDSSTQKKLTGVELLKEQFTYYAKLQTSEDMEKDREKKFKPGTQHLKLKQELEEQIAEQRSLEWSKRLEAENQLKAEANEMEGEVFDGEDIEKIEAKFEEDNVVVEEEESTSEEEEEETDIYVLKEKRRKQNPLIDDEAEVSEDEGCDDEDVDQNGEKDDDNKSNFDDDDDEQSSESEQEEEEGTKPRKGRILKAFEDSDDEGPDVKKSDSILDSAIQTENLEIRESQDDEIQLAQPQKTSSEDLFTSQEGSQTSVNIVGKAQDVNTSLEDLGSQTFSILKSATENTCAEKDINDEKFDVISEMQPCIDDNFDAIAGMCTGGFTENLITPQDLSPHVSKSQEIGEDVLALCTGKFYDNPFISQDEGNNTNNVESNIYDKSTYESNRLEQAEKINILEEAEDTVSPPKFREGDNRLLKSILEELEDPQFVAPKPNNYFFVGNNNSHKDNTQNIENTQLRKKFVIESDDECNEEADVTEKKKKQKKRKLADRALQISDDEDVDSEPEEVSYDSDLEEEDNDRQVEYDSEENEVEVQAKIPKKKRIGNDFFEQEAELTSEDEWVGSGDEDEAGLDRMEREAGDDDTFHQGKLQRELGEIHMREVLDQDRREVRLLQELLFEDGDLGDGHRQRKFRWKNADGEEEVGTNVDEYADTQEDEFESEEQWRKQRHEREMFLRKLQEKDEDSNIVMNRSAIIKSNLNSRSTTCSTLEQTSYMHDIEKPKALEIEKKTPNDIPSPKKPFTIFQQSYHTSLLARGRGALTRLAALATPLAGDGDDTPKLNAPSSRGNFVFTTLTPDETEPKVTKRKGDTNPDTPRLLKKMKQQAHTSSKSSLLDHL